MLAPLFRGFARSGIDSVAAQPKRRRRRGSREARLAATARREGVSLEALEPRAMLAAFTYGAGILSLSLDTANESIAINATGANSYSITSNQNFTGSDIAGKLTGSGTKTLTVDSSLGLAETIATDTKLGATVIFNGGTPGSTYDADFLVTLALPGAGTCGVAADTHFTGNHFVAVQAARINVDAALTTEGGAITLDANDGTQALIVPAGVVVGVAGSVTTAGGAILIDGRGGDNLLGNQVGVSILGDVHAGDNGVNYGTVTISGLGGASGADGNHGVSIGVGGAVSSTGGAVGITGHGASVEAGDIGVLIAGLIETTSAAGAPGNVTVEGFGGGGLLSSGGNVGVQFVPGGAINTAAGAISITGHDGVGPTSLGIFFDHGQMTSVSGDLAFTSSSFDANLTPGGVVSTGGTASYRNLTLGQVIDLGASTNGFLAAIAAPHIVVGRSDVLPVITQSPAPGGALTLAAGRSLRLIGSAISLQAGITTPGAEQVYSGPVTLGPANVVLTGSSATFESTIAGGGKSLSVVGNAVFDNAVTGLLNLGVSGTTLAAANITTTGTQTYGGTMTLGAPLVTLVGTTGSFGGGVAGAGNSLAINLSGATAIDGATFSGIHDLSTGGGGSTTLVGSVITTGIQSYGDAVTLAGDASLATGGGNVLFGNHLDGARNLSINAGTGLVTFAQAVGATNPLGSLAIHSAAGVTASSTVALDGSAVGAAPNGLVIATGVNAVDMHVAGSTVRNYSGSGIILQSSLASTVSGFTVEDNGAYGVFVEGDVSGSVVSGNTIQGNVVGVYLAGAGGLLVNGANQILGNTAYGIYGSGTAASTTTIAGNLVDGQGVSSYGAFLDNAKNIHIGAAGLGGGNTISHAAIGIYAADGLASSRVINNVIDHNGSGVVLMHTRHLAIEGANQLLDNASFGILAQGAFLDTSISGNTISGSIVGVNLSDATGIVVDGGNQILGNTAHGVYAVGDGTDSIVRGNSINGSGVGAFGVFLDGVAGLTLGGTLGGEGNTVTGSSIGLYARGSLAGTAVRGNTFDANGSGAVIAAAADLLINTGNHFTHSTSYGLLAQGVCDGTVIAGNTLGTSAVGLGLSGATGLVVNGGNQLVGNTSLGMYATGVADGSRVTGNTIDGIGSGVFGMFLDGVTGLVAGDTGVGNDVTGWQVGVYARGALGGSVVASNIVTGNGTGAVLTGATGLLVNGGNRFGDSTAYGLLAEGASDGSVVAGNLIDANVVGVCIVGASGLTVRDGNQILGNSAQGVYATGDATGTKVVGNTINGVGTGAFGVFLDGVTGMTVGELPAGGINTITGYSNGIYAQGNLLGSTVANNALTGNQSGIVLVSASDLAVRDGNRVIGSSAFGLYGSGDCAGTVVEANSFEGNSSGVVLDGARNLNIVNLNRMISNTAFGLYAKGVSTGTTVMGNTISGNGQNVETSAATGGTFQTS